VKKDDLLSFLSSGESAHPERRFLLSCFLDFFPPRAVYGFVFLLPGSIADTTFEVFYRFFFFLPPTFRWPSFVSPTQKISRVFWHAVFWRTSRGGLFSMRYLSAFPLLVPALCRWLGLMNEQSRFRSVLLNPAFHALIDKGCSVDKTPEYGASQMRTWSTSSSFCSRSGT